MAAAILALVTIAIWAGRSARQDARPPAPAPPQAPVAVDQTAIASDLGKARQALQDGDFAAAGRHADAVLALAPDHAEARRIRDQAASTLDSVTRGIQDARDAMAAGRFEEASRAAGKVLGLAPGNPEARQLMQEAAARSSGRGADEARARMNEAKRAARAASAPTLAAHAYDAALGTERTAQRLFEAGNLADATARFYEASGLYRSAEISAKSEAAAQGERAEAERRAQTARAAQAAKAEQERQDRERAAAAAASTTAPPPTVPSAAPATAPSRGSAPPAPGAAPAPSPTKPSPTPEPTPPEPSAESLITDLLAHYKTALEARSLTAVKRIWPGLGGVRESALRDEFEQASRISVTIEAPNIEVAGAAATVTFTRRYELETRDGQRLRSQSLTTMQCRRTAAGWVIDQVRYDPIR